MKKLILLTIAFLGLSLSCSAQGKVKTINVVPDNAKIILNGAEVGQGSYDLTIGRQDYVMLRLSCPGYVDRVVRVYKADKRKSLTFTLEEDNKTGRRIMRLPRFFSIIYCINIIEYLFKTFGFSNNSLNQSSFSFPSSQIIISLLSN